MNYSPPIPPFLEEKFLILPNSLILPNHFKQQVSTQYEKPKLPLIRNYV